MQTQPNNTNTRNTARIDATWITRAALAACMAFAQVMTAQSLAPGDDVPPSFISSSKIFDNPRDNFVLGFQDLAKAHHLRVTSQALAAFSTGAWIMHARSLNLEPIPGQPADDTQPWRTVGTIAATGAVVTSLYALNFESRARHRLYVGSQGLTFTATIN